MACEKCQQVLDSLRDLPTKQDGLAIPQYMWAGLARYVVPGIRPGDFLMAVLSNDLREACARADDENRRRLFDYTFWLENYARAAWGDRATVKAWLDLPREYDPTCDLVVR